MIFITQPFHPFAEYANTIQKRKILIENYTHVVTLLCSAVGYGKQPIGRNWIWHERRGILIYSSPSPLVSASQSKITPWWDMNHDWPILASFLLWSGKFHPWKLLRYNTFARLDYDLPFRVKNMTQGNHWTKGEAEGGGFCRYWGPRIMFFIRHGRPRWNTIIASSPIDFACVLLP